MSATLDLVVLVADQTMEKAVDGLLSRPMSLGTREISYKITRALFSDASTLLNAQEWLRPYLNKCDYAIAMFDLEGCGAESSTREELENRVKAKLRANGWDNRCAAVVLDPELEIWAWSRSPHLEQALGWTNVVPGLWQWLEHNGWLHQGQPKPDRPKEAMRAALREVRKPWSSSIHAEIARSVGLTTCIDPAFAKWRSILQTWFAE